MSIAEIIAIILGIYSTIVSTILGIREVRRDRRRITVILEYIAWHERGQVTIVNSGHRPITVTEIGMSLFFKHEGDGYWDRVPRNAMFGQGVEHDSFPVIIRDGESITLPLSDVVSSYLSENRMKAKLSVYDVEGNKYTKFQTRMHDPKWGSYKEMAG